MTRLLITSELKGKNTIAITGDELHYMRKVKRHKAGDELVVQDMEGALFEAKVECIEPDKAVLAIHRRLCQAAACLPICLVVSVPKRNLMDDIVRQASEIGVERLIPMTAARTVVNPGEGKLERWRRIAWESRRQCRRKTQMEVLDIATFEQALKSLAQIPTKILMDTEPSAVTPLWSKRSLEKPICAVIGPEGGFTKHEVEIALSLGFQPAGLGPTILRVETAAIATAILLAAIIGGFG